MIELQLYDRPQQTDTPGLQSFARADDAYSSCSTRRSILPRQYVREVNKCLCRNNDHPGSNVHLWRFLESVKQNQRFYNVNTIYQTWDVYLTSATNWIPPLNHLYLLRFVLTQCSSLSRTACSFSWRPCLLSTTHARGLISSDIRDPGTCTPATVASLTMPLGSARSTSSISAGDTWRPDIFRVSYVSVSRWHVNFAAE